MVQILLKATEKGINYGKENGICYPLANVSNVCGTTTLKTRQKIPL